MISSDQKRNVDDGGRGKDKPTRGCRVDSLADHRIAGTWETRSILGATSDGEAPARVQPGGAANLRRGLGACQACRWKPKEKCKAEGRSISTAYIWCQGLPRVLCCVCGLSSAREVCQHDDFSFMERGKE